MLKSKILLLLVAILAIIGCNKNDDPSEKQIHVISISINGSPLTDETTSVPTNASISLSFSASLSQIAFESELSLTSAGGKESLDVQYTNSSAKATIDLMLEPATEYTLLVNAAEIGANGEQLKEAINLSFETQVDSIITSLPPCLSTTQCLRSKELEGTLGKGNFEFYSNYPIYEENAIWEKLTQAVIVVHGASINPDDYFSYLTATLNALSLSEETVLVSPYFRSSDAENSNDFHWSSLNYRDGRQSSNPNKISSFAVLDSLITQLADKSHFPKLDKIIVTGQSSGGRFTHIYAAANSVETNNPDLTFHYVVSESQYFYYPDGQRIDENTNELYTPSGCTGYDIWPFGFNVVPLYVSNTTEDEFNLEFVNRSITYLLGSGVGTDNSLNTTDCSATLLGSSRFQRGKNMMRYMELVYPNEQNHSKVIAQGIIHNGSAIYQSDEFRELLQELLN